MKTFHILSLILLVITIAGCVNNSDNEVKKPNVISETCNAKESELCNRNCRDISDCKNACPIGCINKNQKYEPLLGINCITYHCTCEDNECQPQYKYSEDR